MNWHYAKGGTSIGPVTDEQLAALAGRGEIDDGTLVWHEGLANWQSFGAVRPKDVLMPPVLPTTPALDSLTTCSVCRGHFAPDDLILLLGQRVCANCKPTLLQGLREGAQVGVSNVWRSGRTLVMARGATLPNCCFKCGSPTQGTALKRRLYWHHPALYLTILLSLLIYVIIALIVRKRADITLPLCARHWQQRRLWLTIGWVTSLAGVFTIIAGIAAEAAWGFWGILLILVGICGGNFGARMTYAKRIDDQHIWLAGAGPTVINGLPGWPGK